MKTLIDDSVFVDPVTNTLLGSPLTNNTPICEHVLVADGVTTNMSKDIQSSVGPRTVANLIH